ncbi:MAG: hypothetical protein B7Y99_03895 [Caulobacterales bacterium 32-69-10]|nr:MAG: hypothetical protein B7Y99_03895 [Caulobacterales bacterium 32-69-10]
MKRDHDPVPDPAVVSLESHRRRRAAESRAQSQAKAAKAKTARTIRAGAVPGERAINWRRAPIALVALALFLAAGWLIRLVTG